MGDLARVTQFVHKPLHHFLILRNVRIEELEDQPVVDHGIFHQQHRAKGTLADALDVLVAALHDVARRQRGNIEFGCAAGFGGAHLLNDFVIRPDHGNRGGIGRAQRLAKLRNAAGGRYRWQAASVEPSLQAFQRAGGGARHCGVTRAHVLLQLHADLLDALVVC